MSNDEKRALQGAVLLEFEDAKADLALLRIKVRHWYNLQEKVSRLLARAVRESQHLEDAAAEARAEIERSLPDLAVVMNIEAVLALDSELEKAVQRVKAAEAAKKSLGF